MSTIFVVGIGPGAYEKMTIEAADALRNCDGKRTFCRKRISDDADAERGGALPSSI